MRRTCFRKMHCLAARSLEHVGERWREFQESLGVAPNTERIHCRCGRPQVAAGAA